MGAAPEGFLDLSRDRHRPRIAGLECFPWDEGLTRRNVLEPITPLQVRLRKAAENHRSGCRCRPGRRCLDCHDAHPSRRFPVGLANDAGNRSGFSLDSRRRQRKNESRNQKKYA